MKNLKKIQMYALAGAMAFFTLSCNDDDNETVVQEQTIAEIAASNPNFSTLVTALNRAGLTSTLNGTEEFTVFAPTNDAFDRLFLALDPDGNLDVENVPLATLKNILLNHVVRTEIKSGDIPASTYVSTLSPISTAQNAPTISMFVQKSGATVTLNGGSSTTAEPNRKGATVTTADVDASNGVIHIVDRVIQIPNVVDHAVMNPNFTTLVGLLDGAGLVPTLNTATGAPSPFTVFAPTNTAFTDLNTEIPGVLGTLNAEQVVAVLTYHVIGSANVRSNAIPASSPTIEGGILEFSGTTITDERGRQSGIITTSLDVQASNGVIHAINKVLLPEF